MGPVILSREHDITPGALHDQASGLFTFDWPFAKRLVMLYVSFFLENSAETLHLTSVRKSRVDVYAQALANMETSSPPSAKCHQCHVGWCQVGGAAHEFRQDWGNGVEAVLADRQDQRRGGQSRGYIQHVPSLSSHGQAAECQEPRTSKLLPMPIVLL